MRIALQTFRLPKGGNSEAEYEDACWPETDAEYTAAGTLRAAADAARVLRFAVADGATETLFSGLWASQLARAYCDASSHAAFLAAIPPLRADWQQAVASRPLPWYAEEKARAGAFATLLGLTLKTGHAQNVAFYQALAIGDSCLFHVREGRLLRAFPLTRAADFNNSPYLLASHPQRNPDLSDHLHTTAHRAVPGDSLLLLTDALAQWFLAALEADPIRPAPLSDLTTLDAFTRLVQQEREAHRLRNDDTTLLRLTLLSEHTPGTR